MKNSEYWEKRIANSTWKTYNSLEEKNKALLEMYQEASLSISDELYRVAEKMKTGTPTLSDMHKFNRLTGLQKNMENIIRELGENVEKFANKNIQDGIQDAYKNVMVGLGATEFDRVPSEVMEQMMRTPWQGNTFSKRLWKNTQVLVSNLNDILVNGLTQGKTVTEMAIQLNNAMNTGFNVCHRLVRTETMHYLNESSKRAYKDGGCEEIQYWAAKDERTCEICGAKHEKIYKIDKAPILPLHANCRCTFLPIVQDNKKDDIIRTKKEAIKRFKEKYGIQFKDSRKYPMDEELIVDCVNWLDSFQNRYKSFIENNPCKIPIIICNPPSKMQNSVGHYSYYPNSTKVVEIALNGQYHSDSKLFNKYVQDCIKSKWYPANATIHKTFVHEYGHHVSNSLKNITKNQNFQHEFLQECINDFKEVESKYVYNSHVGMGDYVSRYGASSESELFAEAFAEYYGGDNPRTFAKIFGTKLDKILKKVK